MKKIKKDIIPEYISAAILINNNKPLKILQIEMPELKEGQVLVKILYSGVCRSQLMEIDGARGKDRWLPHMLGHEASGVVVKIGKGVSKVKAKDPVILTWIKCKGKETKESQIFYSNNLRINAGHITTFSNYSIVSENRVVIKPKNLDFKVATLFGCALPTGSGMILNQVKPKKKSFIAVIGLGGIGLSAIAALNNFSCKIICAIDINDKKLILAKKLGATHCINIRKKNLQEYVSEITKNHNFDYCVESGGSLESIEQAFSILNKNKGKLVFASHPKHGTKIKLDPHELIAGKKIEGSWGGQTKPDKDIVRLYNIIKKNKIPIEQIITKTYNLENINNAINDLKIGKVFRPIIKMKH